jgi:hypothetical protein
MADDRVPPIDENEESSPPPPRVENEVPASPEPPGQAANVPPSEPPHDESLQQPGPPPDEDDLKPRLERLGGEPAPDITPEEFARLQEAGQIHIDPRGRVRTTRRDETDAGISLRKRRAWYTAR